MITDNTTFFFCGVYPVVFECNALIKNCTIANNESGLSVGTATIENCIIYNNGGPQLVVTNGNTVNISYSNVQDGLEGVVSDGHVNWGPGNIDTDPCFVRLGDWITDEITLIEGDYHLRSEGWRWNTEDRSWTYNYTTSRCVDAGNPGSPLLGELMSVPRDPNNVWGVNLRINMGAFGGTSQASMPPYDWALLADLNNDGTTNFMDFAYQAQDWLTIAPEQPGDLNRDSVLNTIDLRALVEEWLQTTIRIE
ncbi:MAG: right-handed parallel beta-helix repeat-containing protein [Planctomycetota bacterium]